MNGGGDDDDDDDKSILNYSNVSNRQTNNAYYLYVICKLFLYN